MQVINVHSGVLAANVPFLSSSYSSKNLLGYIVSPLAPVGEMGLWGSFEVLVGNNVYRKTGGEQSFFQYNRIHPIREEFRLMDSQIRFYLLPEFSVNVSIDLIVLDSQPQQETPTMFDWQVGDLIFSMSVQNSMVQRWSRLWVPLPSRIRKSMDERIQPLFIDLWQYSTIWVEGGRGANALADWNADKELFLPDPNQRAVGVTNGSKMGVQEGQSTHSLSVGQLPPHKHKIQLSYGASELHTHINGGAPPMPSYSMYPYNGSGWFLEPIENVGNGEEFSLMQPTSWFTRSVLVCASNSIN